MKKFSKLTVLLGLIVMFTFAFMMSVSAAGEPISVTGGGFVDEPFTSLELAFLAIGTDQEHENGDVYTITLTGEVEMVGGQSGSIIRCTTPQFPTIITGGTLTINGTIWMGAMGNLTFEDIILNAPDSRLYGNGYDVLIGDNVTTTADRCFFDIYGGCESGGLPAASTNVEIRSGTFLNIYGGGYHKEVIGSTNVTISGDAIIKQYVYGGGEYSTVGTFAVEASTNVTILGGTVGDVYGGGRQDESDVVSTANVTILGGTVGTVYGGGYVYTGNGSTTVGTANITIGGDAIIRYNVYGGGQYDASVDTANITILGGSVGWDVYGGGANNATVTNSKVMYLSGTIGLISKGNAENVDGYVIAATESAGKSKFSTNFLTANITYLGKGFYADTTDPTSVVLKFDNTINSHGFTTTKLEMLTGETWGDLTATPFTVPNNYSNKLRFTGTFNSAPIQFEQTVQFEVKGVVLSTNAGVQSVKINDASGTISGMTITVELPSNTTALPTDITAVEIVTSNANAVISDLVTMDDGATWTFTVTAEDGVTTANYTINVSILPVSTNAGVQSVKVNNVSGAINGTTITVELPSNTTELPTDITAVEIVTSNAYAVVSDLATSDDGVTWTFTVTAEDGVTTANYTINVSIATVSEPEEKTIWETIMDVIMFIPNLLMQGIRGIIAWFQSLFNSNRSVENELSGLVKTNPNAAVDYIKDLVKQYKP